MNMLKKKIVLTVLMLCLLTASLSACSDNVSKSPTATKVADMLYEMTYDDYSSEIPDDSMYDILQGDMACSCVRNGNYFGRNFDFFMSQSPTLVIRTTAKEGRYATIGIGRLAKINSDDVDTGLSQDNLDIIPWSILDGINEKGLVCGTNVVMKADWGNIPHTGTNPGAPDLNVTFIPRAVLDNCATVDEAIEYIKNHNITPLPSEFSDLHVMISDPVKNCVVEFINNEVVAKEQYIMTNYFLNIDDTPNYPVGLERMQILKEHYDEGNTMEGMYDLMRRVRYTNSYYVANGWYSELGLTYEQLQDVDEEFKENLRGEQADFEDELKYLEANGFRETTEWWDTTHNTIYDIENKKIWVTVHERYEAGHHEFSLD